MVLLFRNMALLLAAGERNGAKLTRSSRISCTTTKTRRAGSPEEVGGYGCVDGCFTKEISGTPVG